MKRAGHLYHLIQDYENLRRAFIKASKGKQDRLEVIAYKRNLEVNLQILKNQLLRHNLDIGHYSFFYVRDPKLRLICVASFPERVLHHAVMNICEPVLERYAVYDCYACRKGKGTVKALKRAQYYCSQFKWYLKLDIRKYFDSIDQNIMLQLLKTRFKDKELLNLFKNILATYHTNSGKGVPIGNLISQHLANFYLACFDHWIKEERHITGYIRYMDDFIIFGTEKLILKQELEYVKVFLDSQLKLQLKDNIQLNKCVKGVPFLGFRVFVDKILLKAASKKRFTKKFRKYEGNFLEGRWKLKTLIRHIEPLIAFTKLGQANSFRRKVIERFGVLS
ncbi:MAG: group II intron reverse transcriptase domain-containing protein [Desulfobacterales bacterium]|nr:group II intron reverse transcriptase domain-containing protein [Desulfobacterales bacterium]